jgi:cyclic pyranopterin phosphate synthase
MDLKLSHIDEKTGAAKMVDVSEKEKTNRYAKACGIICLTPPAMQYVKSGKSKKGNILETARIAGICGAKKTSELIPLCHNINLTHIEVDFEINDKENKIIVIGKVRTRERTGVEMEALTAVSITCLTIYDMLKAVDKTITFEKIELLEKKGGKSGNFQK